MSLSNTNLTITQIKTEMGNAVNTVSGQVANSAVNAWSFWSPRALQITGTTKTLCPAPVPSAPYKMGDFRYYNHSAAVPNVSFRNSNFIANPTDTTKSIAISINNQETNIFRASSSIAGVNIRFWKTYSGGVLSNQVGSTTYRALTTAFGANANVDGTASTVRGINLSPAQAGHTVTQTSTIDNGGSEGVVAADFNITADGGITTTNVTRYMEVIFCTSGGGTDICRYPSTGYFAAFNIRKYAQPDLTITTQSYSPNPLYENDTPATQTATSVIASSFTESQTAGDTNWNFSFIPKAIFSGVPVNCSGNVQVKYYWNSTYYNIGSSRAFSEGATITVTDAISGGLTALAYDQVIPIYLEFTGLATTYNAP